MSSPAADVVLQVTPTWDGNKLVRKFEPKQDGSRGKPQTHTFELQDDELILVLSCSKFVG